MKKLFYSIFALVSVVFALTSCEDIPAPYDIPHKGTTDVVAPAGDGTAANPYNVAAIDSILDSGYSTEDDEQNPYYYITGVICSRPSIETSYGNATYYISDDGTSTNQFYIYRSLSFNGVKFTSTDDLQYGDTVVVYTQVYSYSGTYETRSGVCKLISVKRNGQSQGGGGSSEGSVTPTGTGTQADPFNVAAAVKYVTSLGADVTSDNEVYIKGKVLTNSTTAETISSYGNMSFTIVDEGDESTTFYAFQVYGPGKQKFTSVDQIKAGQTVVICGKVVNYKGNTPETVGKGAAYVVSIDGSGSGSDTPSGDATEVTCAKAAELAMALEDKATSSETYSVTGYITSVVGSVSQNQQTFWMADTKDGGQVFEAYWANLPTGVTEFTVGSKVKITGNLMRYGTTPEIKNATVTILDSGGGSDTPDTPSGDGGVSIDGTTLTLTNSAVTAGSSSVTMVVNDLGITDKASVVDQTYKFSDGTTLTIGQGEGKSGATYYASSNGFRIYANNTLTFSASKPIAKIVIECDAYNGTNYVGQATATVSFSGNTAVYTNAGTGTTQLRAQKITIYYSSSAAKRYAHRR